MNNHKPTALMMKTLYSLLLEVGEAPGSWLADLTHEEAKDWINQLKQQAKKIAKECSHPSMFAERSIRSIDTSSDKELDWIGNQLSLTYFGRPCKIPIEWDKTLKNAAGYFSFDKRTRKPLRIVQSMWQYNQFGAQHVIGTLKHELAHYHLFMEGKPFDDKDVEFKRECQRIHAPLFAMAMHEGFETFCSSCRTYTGLEKKQKEKLKSRCCKSPLEFGNYLLIFPNGWRVEVEK
ncbi:SprT-like domain-containing protein [Ammoniphilus sp. CFH 90114]|uniref:SprT-like domain-containing protein n=1 Tax=Ammoniphilus sp. CFH 90114 TaxID=2493665 RepID=UPI00100FA72E|nr:SprT-like domain-containing protein [Ammoniphilus sp. CFH 90114]RXT02292.1 sprT domain-containing protein [Ammoniphilus sp. CFH 90114]